MKLSASPFVVRVWMPILFILGVYLFFRGTAPVYWLIALPLLLIGVFMSTLAEIQDQGHQIHVQTLWHSIDVPKEDVAGIAQSLVEGVGVLRVRRFVFPWGRVYFVADWSKFGVESPAPEERAKGETKPDSLARAVGELVVVSLSGFLAARAIRSTVHDVGIETFSMRAGACSLALVLCVVFAIVRTRRPSFANVVLFIATFLVGSAL